MKLLVWLRSLFPSIPDLASKCRTLEEENMRLQIRLAEAERRAEAAESRAAAERERCAALAEKWIDSLTDGAVSGRQRPVVFAPRRPDMIDRMRDEFIKMHAALEVGDAGSEQSQ